MESGIVGFRHFGTNGQTASGSEMAPKAPIIIPYEEPGNPYVFLYMQVSTP